MTPYASIELATTGILMGFIYVLTGPDHLSAIATIVGTSLSSKPCNSTRTWSFLLGIKWGIGNSIGLLIIGSILIATDSGGSGGSGDEWIMIDDTNGLILEGFVGIYMLCLGSYGMLKARKNRNSGALMQQGLPGESIELNTQRAPRRTNSHLLKVKESYKEHQSDDESLDVSFLEQESDATERAKGGGNNNGTEDLIHSMSVVLNRDGDSMRDDSNHKNFDPSDAADVERRILAAAASLRQNVAASSKKGSSPGSSLKRRPSSFRQGSMSPKNSSTSSTPSLKHSGSLEVDEEQFTNTLTSSAKGALSNSFLSILDRSDKPAPMKASDFTRKHAAPEHSIIHHVVDEDSSWNSRASRLSGRLRCCVGGISSSILAIITGLVHGVAGTAGVLGVIPAVELRDPSSAAMYLSTFCFTSIIAMGVFAVFYLSLIRILASGGGSRRSDGNHWIYIIEGGSALLSIACGIIWLALLSVGKVQEL